MYISRYFEVSKRFYFNLHLYWKNWYWKPKENWKTFDWTKSEVRIINLGYFAILVYKRKL